MAIEYQFDEDRTATLNQLMSAYITNSPSGGSQISGLQGSLTPQEISNITDKISNPTQKAVASFVLSKVGYPYSQPLETVEKHLTVVPWHTMRGSQQVLTYRLEVEQLWLQKRKV